FARPEIRFFASYFKDNENDNTFNSGKSDDTINYGVQIEAWW
ncbi:carbohydrate porin, partial [Vibrio furnissii]